MIELEHRRDGWKTDSGNLILCDHGTDDASRILHIGGCGALATWLGASPYIRYACDSHAEWLRSKQVRGI